MSNIDIESTTFAGTVQRNTRAVTAKTTDYVVLAGDHNKIFTNTGASGAVKFTLPASAGCTAGKTRFTFFATAAQQIQIEVLSSDHLFVFNISDGIPYDVTGGSIINSASTQGETITIQFLGGTTWGALNAQGNWAV